LVCCSKIIPNWNLWFTIWIVKMDLLPSIQPIIVSNWIIRLLVWSCKYNL
jgi:hypothetical protein